LSSLELSGPLLSQPSPFVRDAAFSSNYPLTQLHSFSTGTTNETPTQPSKLKSTKKVKQPIPFQPLSPTLPIPLELDSLDLEDEIRDFGTMMRLSSTRTVKGLCLVSFEISPTRRVLGRARELTERVVGFGLDRW